MVTAAISATAAALTASKNADSQADDRSFGMSGFSIHTNTNDDDVNVLEVEHLIEALKAAGKKFDYEIFKDAPGGHSFDRIDTKLAKQTRLKIYKFLAGYLKPPSPFKSVDDLEKTGYR